MFRCHFCQQITPPKTTRHSVVIEVREKRISRDEVYIADEAFFTGTAAEVVPIREYDSRIIGNGKRGPVATVLQAAYFDLVRGKSDKYQDWLAPVAK